MALTALAHPHYGSAREITYVLEGLVSTYQILEQCCN